MNILKAVNLRKIYGQGETEVRALDGINLEVEKGEFVAIVGTSGSGKSKLLHIIGGLDNPTSGQVIEDGQNLSHMTCLLYTSTHADYFYGEIPCVRCLTKEEINSAYEENTGHLIVSEFKRMKLSLIHI